MKVKRTQLVMLWLLPLIVIGGFFLPILGYLVVAMMAFFLVLSVFAGRFWCWNLCPRGAFLDIVMSRLTLNRRLPRLFTRMWFRWLVFAALLGVLAWRIISTGGHWLAMGMVFVTMCAATTVIAIILGASMKHRGWCMICPMGTLQQQLGQLRRRKKPGK